MDLTETFAKLINGQFFVVYLTYGRHGRPTYIHKLDGEFIPRAKWLAAKVAAERSA